ncbi:MAG TPA: hypothetical protein VLK29_09045, partial [Luteimonas sp.]|nr:hypothetical protein [Luteimonas sp.]
MLRIPTLVACTTLLLAASVAQTARAEEYRQNATGLCQAALPAYDGLIRKRPVAIRNEGDAAAFVSCSL